MDRKNEEILMPIKSFRGLIASGGQDTISLHTNTGNIGYRIVKFNIMPNVPGDSADQEHIVMIWKTKRTAAELADNTTTRPDFSNQVLLGTGILVNDIGSSLNYDESIIFDNETFNQDIFVTARDIGGSTQSCNYYIELEQVKLDLNENTVATLKDIRNIESGA